MLCVGISTYRVEPDPYQIQAEIMKHGPIEVDFMVYEDFLSYKSGERLDRISGLFLVYLFI